MNEPLEQKLAALRLGRIRQIYPSWIEQAATSNLGYV
jgi:DNA replication protein DnaC